MSEKVKVSKDVADAIEYILNHEHYGYTKETLLVAHAKMEIFPKRCWIEAKALNDIELLDLAAILVNGYEVEQTPEEKVIEYYNYFKNKGEDFTAEVVASTVQLMNVEIKGVNC